MSCDGDDSNALLGAELEQVKKELVSIDDIKLIAAVPALVRVEIKWGPVFLAKIAKSVVLSVFVDISKIVLNKILSGIIQKCKEIFDHKIYGDALYTKV